VVVPASNVTHGRRATGLVMEVGRGEAIGLSYGHTALPNCVRPKSVDMSIPTQHSGMPAAGSHMRYGAKVLDRCCTVEASGREAASQLSVIIHTP